MGGCYEENFFFFFLGLSFELKRGPLCLHRERLVEVEEVAPNCGFFILCGSE